MILQLETLPYQQQAIDAVLGVFDGQPRNSFANSFMFEAQVNRCDLTPAQLRENAERVMRTNGLDPVKGGHLTTEEEFTKRRDFCIEMETGTGKTLVYLQTLYKLYQDYGFSKFIILVPSVAIRAGVVGTMDNFADQLAARYGFRLGLFAYDSKRLSKVRDFITNPAPQVMVTTIQAFTSDVAILNQTGRDNSIDGVSYLQALGRTCPIVVMDEPQEGMDTKNATDRLHELNPLAVLRYSATHKLLLNRLYRLTPFDSYREGLVKKVEVLTVAEKNDEASLKIELTQVDAKKVAEPKAKLLLWKQEATGIKWKESTWLKKGDKLAEKASNPSYAGYEIERIWKPMGKATYRIAFTNGVEVEQGHKAGDMAGLFRLQLRYLLKRHFEKRARLRAKGIKCLALVFVDQVANYLGDTPLVKNLFEEEYRTAHTEHLGAVPTPEQVQAVQGYYFAATVKNPSSPDDYTDSAKVMSGNGEMYKLILKQKDKLLAFDNPVEVIFTHSALGVGWDNPNIFTIATLNQAYSDVRKRQEIGRGLRLAVNQEGVRQRDQPGTPEDEEINLLTVVPNETYRAFVNQYQDDLREADGEVLPGAPLRRRHLGDPPARTTVRRNETVFASPAFREFWQRLALRTDYTVEFDEAALADAGVAALSGLRVPTYTAEVSLNRLQSLGDNEKGAKLQAADLGTDYVAGLNAQLAPLDVVEELSEGSGLAYTTVLTIMRRLPDEALNALASNPVRWVQLALPKLAHLCTEHMLRGLTYRVLPGQYYDEAELFPATWDELEAKLVPTPERGLYDYVRPDSAPETKFAEDADDSTRVLCFLKFPAKYRIPIPGGRNYEPDWGVVYQYKPLSGAAEAPYYFVVETKSTNTLDDTKQLSADERFKMQCATRHFAAVGLQAYVRYAAPIKDFASFEERLTHPAEADYTQA